MPPKRPTAVTVIAIISIIYSSLFLLICPLCVGLGVMILYPQLDQMAQNNPDAVQLKIVFDGLFQNDTIKIYMIASFAISLLLGLMLLIGAIGLLKLRSWARTTCILYAVLAILVQVGSFILNLTVLASEFEAWEKQMMAQQGLPQAPKNPVLEGLTGVAGMLIPIALSITILAILLSPRVAAAFKAPTYDSYDDDRRYDDDYGLGRPPDDDDRRRDEDYDRREDDYDRQ